MTNANRASGGRLHTRASWVVAATSLTGVVFAVLHHLALLGTWPLLPLLGVLALAAVVANVSEQYLHRGASMRTVHTVLVAQLLSVAAVTYSIGWGPALAIGYAIVVAADIDLAGSRTWRPALLWTAVATFLGQCAIAAGWVPTYIKAPYVHGVATLSTIGIGFILYVVGSKTAEQERTDAELRASEANFRRLFSDNPQPMWVHDRDTLTFLEVNDAAVAHYGYPRDAFLSRTVADVVVDGDHTHHRTGDGRVIDVEAHRHELHFEDRPAVLVTVQDVTQRNALEKELRHQAFHDALTDLANRALFRDRVDHALGRRRRNGTNLAVLLLDLDGFKTVNDSLGHTIGDALLVAVAGRVAATLRSGDTAARLGGDEFAVLLEDLDDGEDAQEIAERLIDAIAVPVPIAGTEVFVRASIGITVGGTHGDTADELLRNADAAMYHAKAHGKGRCRVFEPAMHSAAVARLELETDLRRALDEDEFVVHYQPIVATSTGVITGFEALVRWDHPRRGLVPPLDFIPLAEENGLVVDIGRFVLREACAQLAQWRRTRPALSMSVNVSARQLADPRLVDDVIDALRAATLDPAALTLEITESAVIEDPHTAVARLATLKTIGVRIAVDDFGTGYSSLSSLRDLPVDTLKIDKTFIDGVTVAVEADGVVHAIIGLAHTLRLGTVAEGVEHPEQVRRLEQLGCEQVQGYCFSKPLAAPDATDLLDRSHPAAAA